MCNENCIHIFSKEISSLAITINPPWPSQPSQVMRGLLIIGAASGLGKDLAEAMHRQCLIRV
jgi:hypothetical protein